MRKTLTKLFTSEKNICPKINFNHDITFGTVSCCYQDTIDSSLRAYNLCHHQPKQNIPLNH